jgi:signal transduction histidine kinase
VLQLKDDGVGFDPGRTAEGTTDHYGIITMRERAQQAGGDVIISSAPGRGTTVEARLPTTTFAAEEAQV